MPYGFSRNEVKSRTFPCLGWDEIFFSSIFSAFSVFLCSATNKSGTINSFWGMIVYLLHFFNIKEGSDDLNIGWSSKIKVGFEVRSGKSLRTSVSRNRN